MTTALVTEHHFTDLRAQIADFKVINETITFDYESINGEKEARSHIYTMRQSKSAVTKRHKEDKADAKKVCDELDAAKRELIYDIEEMIEVHDAPLRDKKARIEAEEALNIMLADWDNALAEDDIFNREREMQRKEAEMKRLEEERIENERLEKKRVEDERLQKEREEQIRKEAIAKAEREKKEAEEKARIALENAELENLEAEFRLKQEQKNAKRAAEEAETKRLADIQAAEDRAELEKIEALNKAKQEQEEKERKERERIKAEKAIEDTRKADVEHRRKINNAIKEKLVELGCKDCAERLIEAIIKGEVPNTTINY